MRSLIFEPVQRTEYRCDVRRFRSFNHSTCKTVLNLMEASYLRHLTFTFFVCSVAHSVLVCYYYFDSTI